MTALTDPSRSTAAPVAITVYGAPAPQGSKQGFVVNGRAVLVESSKKVKPWRVDVKQAALAVLETHNGHPQPMLGPLCVEVTFTLPKPVSAPKRRVTWPDRRPDLDKLVRSTFDGLGESGIWKDDSQVVEVTARKVYPEEGIDALRSPGAVIRVWRLPA